MLRVVVVVVVLQGKAIEVELGALVIEAALVVADAVQNVVSCSCSRFFFLYMKLQNYFGAVSPPDR